MELSAFILIANKQLLISLHFLKLLNGTAVFLLLYWIWETGCGGCAGWSKLQADLGLCPFQSAISAVKHDLATAYHTYFSLTSGRCCSLNKRATCLVVMPSVSSFCWSSGCAGSGTKELHTDFLRNMNNKEQSRKSQITPVSSPLAPRLAGWMLICLTFKFLESDLIFVNCFCLKMECKNCDYSIRTDCQTNYHPPSKQLGNSDVFTCLSSIQGTYFVHGAVETIKDVIWVFSEGELVIDYWMMNQTGFQHLD